MKVTLAKSAGFCYGVRRAVELAERTAEEGRPCVMLGSIIHNKDVIARLAEKGLTAVERPEDVPEGSAVIIRSHGEGRAVYDQLRARGVEILDATCPNVTRIHQIVAQAEEMGRQPGDRGHAGPPGGDGHRRMVQPPSCGFWGGRVGKMAGSGRKTPEFAPYFCISNNVHPENLG